MKSPRFFDENKNEIILPPVNRDNLVKIGEIGGEADEYKLYITFYSESLDKDEITEELKTTPTKAWNPNEMLPHRGRAAYIMREWGKWWLELPKQDIELEVGIRELLSKCTDDLDAWKYLASKYEATFCIVVYMNNRNREFYLEPEIHKMISDRNLGLNVDIYYEGPDDEDDDGGDDDGGEEVRAA